ncbi:hypothetical protein MSG28_001575 [Choristoneura fumiferana]|uniref:Uncharacterized protein n=1 Tax=Choristoneura fumiferana TaxID=7141 RepID=A0ACC0KV49_CHOFU|nr:hypothetical protein MSG28_001575 [Choristoneura fumiferana]
MGGPHRSKKPLGEKSPRVAGDQEPEDEVLAGLLPFGLKTSSQHVGIAATVNAQEYKIGLSWGNERCLVELHVKSIFWKLWCLHVDEITRGIKLWPHLSDTFKCSLRKRWTDKDLYLGSIRHAEDQIRPTPIPGLGRTDEIKLLYLKPEYFGCWDQAEHWVQCDEVLETTTCDYDLKMLSKQNNW